MMREEEHIAPGKAGARTNPFFGALQKAKDMAVPKRRTSHARQGKRRSHLHLKPRQIQYCSHCEHPVQPHHVCSNCGYYQNREIVPVEEEK